jgi:peptide/nickel transport system permease protein
LADVNTSIWQKLRRRRAAMIAIYTIAVTCLVAVFAYPLAPDDSPNANRMITELGAKPPGFTKLFLLQPRQNAVKKQNLLAKLLTGKEPTHDLIPINSFFFARDSIIVEHYIDEGLQDTRTFSLKALLPPNMHKQPLGKQQMAVYHEGLSKRTFLLGTDFQGRDILSRLLVGTRISMAVGIVAALLSLCIGILLGSLAGYYKGWVDNTLVYLINVIWAIPTLLLVFAITLSTGKGFLQILIVIGVTMWVGSARLIRGQVLALRELEYVQAAKTLGFSNMRIIFRHILPNMGGPLMAIAASNFAAAILIEAGLSFLGIGVQAPIPSWGLMIREHYNFLITNRAALALVPGLAIMILVCAFNILGNALRNAGEANSPIRQFDN